MTTGHDNNDLNDNCRDNCRDGGGTTMAATMTAKETVTMGSGSKNRSMFTLLAIDY
jgi:hypothetical protein